MATPLVATWRLDFPITVDHVAHHLRTYLKAQVGTGPSGYDAVLRDGGVPADVAIIANALYGAISGLYDAATTTFGSAILQQLVGVAWLPVAATTITAVPGGSNPYVKAAQVSLTLRDSAFHKIRFIMLEPAQAPGQKFVPPQTGVIGALFDFFTTTPTLGSSHAHNWMVGRSNLYVSSVISYVTDLNDIVRRRRGIA